ncbi:2-oxo-4-hydroxy-4-carboxy-5-ureidoimidazoline decarboxylase [Paenibacillus algorifonticola]|uniref:2-oxo-4-hydroxy-4-carboxy-5-ureidoimidazoline decarboxylase n=1 Tax=Paenibacillus algorifonticola TaxID=684063 RepID=UPI003D2B5A17
MKLDLLNTMSREAFTEALGAIFEHSPWVAELAWENKPFRSVEQLHESMVNAAYTAGEERVLLLIRKHPDLATRISIGEYSTKEQQGAGLSRLTPEEFDQFAALNRQYTEKFGFPFILAVRGKSKADIKEAMAARIGNSLQEELVESKWQIARITFLRLNDLIEE